MSMYKTQYLGVYIELELEYEFINVPERVCEFDHIFENDKAKFCQFDGSEIVTKNKRVASDITIQDLIDHEVLPLNHDDFSIINIDSSDKTWLVQNLTKSKYGIFLDDINFGAYTLSLNSNNVVEEFKDEFKGLITALQNHCKSVKVRYGLIKYYT